MLGRALEHTGQNTKYRQTAASTERMHTLAGLIGLLADKQEEWRGLANEILLAHPKPSPSSRAHQHVAVYSIYKHKRAVLRNCQRGLLVTQYGYESRLLIPWSYVMRHRKRTGTFRVNMQNRKGRTEA